MRDKFQRCNIELLGAKMSPFGVDQLQHDSSSISNNQNNRKPDHLNTEWSLMFGQQTTRAVPESASSSSSVVGGATATATSVSDEPKLKSRGSFRGSPSEPPTPPRLGVGLASASATTSSRKFPNCGLEVERYLDRCKMIYEDQRGKYARVSRAKDSINSSLSSSQVCLSGKWRPRGHLVFHSNEHTKGIDRLSRNADATYFSTLSSADGCVKIWSTESLLTAKSGFYKSVFTYDRQNHGGGGGNSNEQNVFRPACTSFFNRHSLAILCEDYKFYVIDFNSDRTQYRLSSFERLFKSNACKSVVSCNHGKLNKKLKNIRYFLLQCR